MTLLPFDAWLIQLPRFLSNLSMAIAALLSCKLPIWPLLPKVFILCLSRAQQFYWSTVETPDATAMNPHTPLPESSWSDAIPH